MVTFLWFFIFALVVVLVEVTAELVRCRRETRDIIKGWAARRNENNLLIEKLDQIHRRTSESRVPKADRGHRCAWRERADAAHDAAGDVLQWWRKQRAEERGRG